MWKDIAISFKYVLISTLLFGFVYTLSITGIGYLFFRHKANGSLIIKDGTVAGSELIGQKFNGPKWFLGRPSAGNYETIAASASNYGAISKKLKNEVDERIAQWKQIYAGMETKDIPAELLFTSGSGLDPHITPAAALFQLERIIKARNLSIVDKSRLNNIIEGKTQKSFFGQPVINVLELNLAMERAFNGQ